MPDQQAGEVAGGAAGRQVAHQAERAGAEQVVQQPAGFPRARRTPRRKAASSSGPGSASRPRMLCCSSTARVSPVIWVAKPAIRPPASRAHLLWVPGRQTSASASAGQRPATRGPAPDGAGRSRASSRQQPDQLGLLAAHHVRHAAGVARGEAGDQEAGGAGEVQRHHGGGDLGRAGGAGEVGRLDASPAGCRPCRRAGCGVSPAASQGPMAARSASGKPPGGTARMPAGAVEAVEDACRRRRAGRRGRRWCPSRCRSCGGA